MNSSFYARLAVQNLKKNSKFCLPYILTIAGTAAAFYILFAVGGAPDMPEKTRYAYLEAFMGIGRFVVGLVSVIFLFYTNSFLMKRRSREIGLYNILGMDKRNIAVMLSWETLYTAVVGIGGGIILGMLLQKLVTMLLSWLMKYDTSFRFYISWEGILTTALLFGAILFLTLLFNLRRIHVQKPIALLHGDRAGEREPKTRWVLTILGIVTLGAGYGIALWARNPLEALSLYFVAVFLVIFGTYFLFTGVSISVLKLLRRNKTFYYKTGNFIGISGMLYRMKRNAIGLANICILSTMVLVMVSSTVALFLGTGDSMDRRYPAAYSAEVRYEPSQENPFDRDAMMKRLSAGVEEQGLRVTGTDGYTYLGFDAAKVGDEWVISQDLRKLGIDNAGLICFLLAEDYGKITGSQVELDDNDVLLCAEEESGDALTVQFTDAETKKEAEPQTFRVVGQVDDFSGINQFSVYLTDVSYVVVSDETVLNEIWKAQETALGEDSEAIVWVGNIDSDGTPEQQKACAETLCDSANLWINAETAGDWDRYSVSSHVREEEEMYELNAGFLFLGIFLGILFILCTVLIMYYKQISEGYEDRERFQIMQQVGMPEEEVKRSINKQVLLVFFAPLVVAAVHVLFDFQLISKMLMLFQLNNSNLTLGCTAVTFLVFALLYAVVYRATARAYYKIVR